MAIILYFLIIMVESSLETPRTPSNSTHGERAVPYSFGIDDDGDIYGDMASQPPCGKFVRAGAGARYIITTHHTGRFWICKAAHSHQL